MRLQSSNLYDVTAKYPELGGLPDAVAAERVILDGELVVLDDAGRPRFELLQRHERQAALFIFDVLAIERHDVISLPYEERRRLLGELVDPGENWAVPAHRIGGGEELLAATIEHELEGVMAKRLGTTYKPGARTKEWRKIKNRQRAEVVIGGYSPGTGNRSSSFGALLVGRWVDNRLAFAGGVRDGVHATQARGDGQAPARAAHRRHPFDPPRRRPIAAARCGWIPCSRRRWRSPSSRTRVRPPGQLHRPERP